MGAGESSKLLRRAGIQVEIYDRSVGIGLGPFAGIANIRSTYYRRARDQVYLIAASALFRSAVQYHHIGRHTPAMSLQAFVFFGVSPAQFPQLQPPLCLTISLDPPRFI